MQSQFDADEEQEETLKAEIDWDYARELARDINAAEYDEDVQSFLKELCNQKSSISLDKLQQAATLLLQDEIDFSPELAELGIEPERELIELFLVAGAEPNARNSFGELPLIQAAQYGYEDIVDLLLEFGADKNLKNGHGHYAADKASTPALIDKLMPQQAPQEENRGGSPEMMWGEDAEGVDELPDFIQDADVGEADEDYFAPGHDCGCGCTHHKP